MDLPIRLLWDSLETEYESDASIMQSIRAPMDPSKPNILSLPCYVTHPQVRDADRLGIVRPVPLGLYLDGVSYVQSASGRSDSVCGFWAINLITNVRHYLTSLKSSDYCRCGCRGQCSLYPIFSAIESMFHACQEGEVPSHGHDGRLLPKTFSRKPGTKVTRSIMLWIKGDWCEHVNGLGLTRWDAKNSPCQFCSLTKRDIIDCNHGWREPTGPQWPTRSFADYENSCSQCEVSLTIARKPDLEKLSSVLKWDNKPRSGPGGRIVFKEAVINSVKLAVGDRLCPSAELQDTHALSKCSLPVQFKLWRTRRENPDNTGSPTIDPVTLRCPIFSKRIFTSPARSLGIDHLHAVQYGPVVQFIGACLWRCLLKNPWGLTGTMEKILDIGIQHLKGDLEYWQSLPESGVAHNRRVQNLTLKMLPGRGKCNMEDSLFSFMFDMGLSGIAYLHSCKA